MTGRVLRLAALLLLGSACSPTERSPNVLVITLDTVRADHMSLYGYERATTPNLDRFAEDAVVFERAFSNSSFTPPSHASILTSRYPAEHSLTFWSERLGDVPTAASIFSELGYRTVAVTPLPTLLLLGLDRGFDDAIGLPPETVADDRIAIQDADAVNAEALARLTGGEQPWFAWLHYYDAHRPYGRQGPQWATRFGSHPDPGVGADEGDYQLTPLKRARRGLDPDDVEFIKDRYDGGLAWLDDRLGALLSGLQAAGALDDTIVLITADHGEVLDEHDEAWFDHDRHLYDENIHVPLILRLPDGTGAGIHIDALVQGVDVLPTLLELAGHPEAASDMSGMSLAPLLAGRSLRRDFVFAERRGKDISGETDDEAKAARSLDRKRMVRTATHKLIHYVDRERLELLSIDDETVDISASQPERTAKLAEAYRQLLQSERQGGSATTEVMDPETLEMLRKLGYVDG